MRKVIALLLSLVLLGAPAMAHSVWDYYMPYAWSNGTPYDLEYTDTWVYHLRDDGTVMLAGCFGCDEDIVIPEEIDGHPVAALGPSLLYANDWVCSVSIPGCVTQIDGNPFVGCPMLADIRVEADHPSLEVVDGVLFDRIEHRLICYPCAFTARSYAVPEGTRIIGENAFCSIYDGYRSEEADRNITLGDMTFPWGWLAEVSLPEGLTAIEAGAFSFCGELERLYIPDSVQFIGDDAFRGNRALTVQAKPDSYAQHVCEVRGQRFAPCNAAPAFAPSDNAPLRTSGSYRYRLREDGSAEIVRFTGDEDMVEVPAELDGHPVTAIGKGAFCNSYGLRRVVLPEGVAEIGRAAFYECDSLEEARLPGTLERIGDGAFISCLALPRIEIPDGVTDIGANPFAYCQALEEIALSPDHPALEVIDGALFSRSDRRLVSGPIRSESGRYEVPEGTRIIGDLAFYYSPLTSVRLPDSLTTIGEEAFNWGPTVENLPEGTLEIREGAFRQCFGQAAFALPEGTTHIADMLFWGCDDLEEVTLPEGILSIGEMAFAGCDLLSRLTIPASVVYIAPEAFDSNNLVVSVYPDSPALDYCVTHDVPHVVRQGP